MAERKRNKSKNKGNKWENQVYDDIRAAGYFIRKNKGSGNAEDNKGDLETINLLIECKHYKKVNNKMIAGWMDKIYNEALPINKFPVLIVKENYVKPKVYFVHEDGEILSMDYKLWLEKALVTENARINLNIPVKKDLPPIYIG